MKRFHKLPLFPLNVISKCTSNNSTALCSAKYSDATKSLDHLGYFSSFYRSRSVSPVIKDLASPVFINIKSPVASSQQLYQNPLYFDAPHKSLESLISVEDIPKPIAENPQIVPKNKISWKIPDRVKRTIQQKKAKNAAIERLQSALQNFYTKETCIKCAADDCDPDCRIPGHYKKKKLREEQCKKEEEEDEEEMEADERKSSKIPKSCEDRLLENPRPACKNFPVKKRKHCPVPGWKKDDKTCIGFQKIVELPPSFDVEYVLGNIESNIPMACPFESFSNSMNPVEISEPQRNQVSYVCADGCKVKEEKEDPCAKKNPCKGGGGNKRQAVEEGCRKFNEKRRPKTSKSDSCEKEKKDPCKKKKKKKDKCKKDKDPCKPKKKKKKCDGSSNTGGYVLCQNDSLVQALTNERFLERMVCAYQVNTPSEATVFSGKGRSGSVASGNGQNNLKLDDSEPKKPTRIHSDFPDDCLNHVKIEKSWHKDDMKKPNEENTFKNDPCSPPCPEPNDPSCQYRNAVKDPCAHIGRKKRYTPSHSSKPVKKMSGNDNDATNDNIEDTTANNIKADPKETTFFKVRPIENDLTIQLLNRNLTKKISSESQDSSAKILQERRWRSHGDDEKKYARKNVPKFTFKPLKDVLTGTVVSATPKLAEPVTKQNTTVVNVNVPKRNKEEKPIFRINNSYQVLHFKATKASTNIPQDSKIAKTPLFVHPMKEMETKDKEVDMTSFYSKSTSHVIAKKPLVSRIPVPTKKISLGSTPNLLMQYRISYINRHADKTKQNKITDVHEKLNEAPIVPKVQRNLNKTNAKQSKENAVTKDVNSTKSVENVEKVIDDKNAVESEKIPLKIDNFADPDKVLEVLQKTFPQFHISPKDSVIVDTNANVGQTDNSSNCLINDAKESEQVTLSDADTKNSITSKNGSMFASDKKLSGSALTQSVCMSTNKTSGSGSGSGNKKNPSFDGINIFKDLIAESSSIKKNNEDACKDAKSALETCLSHKKAKDKPLELDSAKKVVHNVYNKPNAKMDGFPLKFPLDGKAKGNTPNLVKKQKRVATTNMHTTANSYAKSSNPSYASSSSKKSKRSMQQQLLRVMRSIFKISAKQGETGAAKKAPVQASKKDKKPTNISGEVDTEKCKDFIYEDVKGKDKCLEEQMKKGPPAGDKPGKGKSKKADSKTPKDNSCGVALESALKTSKEDKCDAEAKIQMMLKEAKEDKKMKECLQRQQKKEMRKCELKRTCEEEINCKICVGEKYKSKEEKDCDKAKTDNEKSEEKRSMMHECLERRCKEMDCKGDQDRCMANVMKQKCAEKSKKSDMEKKCAEFEKQKQFECMQKECTEKDSLKECEECIKDVKLKMKREALQKEFDKLKEEEEEACKKKECEKLAKQEQCKKLEEDTCEKLIQEQKCAELKKQEECKKLADPCSNNKENKEDKLKKECELLACEKSLQENECKKQAADSCADSEEQKLKDECKKKKQEEECKKLKEQEECKKQDDDKKKKEEECAKQKQEEECKKLKEQEQCKKQDDEKKKKDEECAKLKQEKECKKLAEKKKKEEECKKLKEQEACNNEKKKQEEECKKLKQKAECEKLKKEEECKKLKEKEECEKLKKAEECKKMKEDAKKKEECKRLKMEAECKKSKKKDDCGKSEEEKKKEECKKLAEEKKKEDCKKLAEEKKKEECKKLAEDKKKEECKKLQQAEECKKLSNEKNESKKCDTKGKDCQKLLCQIQAELEAKEKELNSKADCKRPKDKDGDNSICDVGGKNNRKTEQSKQKQNEALEKSECQDQVKGDPKKDRKDEKCVQSQKLQVSPLERELQRQTSYLMQKCLQKMSKTDRTTCEMDAMKQMKEFVESMCQSSSSTSSQIQKRKQKCKEAFDAFCQLEEEAEKINASSTASKDEDMKLLEEKKKCLMQIIKECKNLGLLNDEDNTSSTANASSNCKFDGNSSKYHTMAKIATVPYYPAMVDPFEKEPVIEPVTCTKICEPVYKKLVEHSDPIVAIDMIDPKSDLLVWFSEDSCPPDDKCEPDNKPLCPKPKSFYDIPVTTTMAKDIKDAKGVGVCGPCKRFQVVEEPPPKRKPPLCTQGACSTRRKCKVKSESNLCRRLPKRPKFEKMCCKDLDFVSKNICIPPPVQEEKFDKASGTGGTCSQKTINKKPINWCVPSANVSTPLPFLQTHTRPTPKDPCELGRKDSKACVGKAQEGKAKSSCTSGFKIVSEEERCMPEALKKCLAEKKRKEEERMGKACSGPTSVPGIAPPNNETSDSTVSPELSSKCAQVDPCPKLLKDRPKGVEKKTKGGFFSNVCSMVYTDGKTDCHKKKGSNSEGTKKYHNSATLLNTVTEGHSHENNPEPEKLNSTIYKARLSNVNSYEIDPWKIKQDQDFSFVIPKIDMEFLKKRQLSSEIETDKKPVKKAEPVSNRIAKQRVVAKSDKNEEAKKEDSPKSKEWSRDFFEIEAQREICRRYTRVVRCNKSLDRSTFKKI